MEIATLAKSLSIIHAIDMDDRKELPVGALETSTNFKIDASHSTGNPQSSQQSEISAIDIKAAESCNYDLSQRTALCEALDRMCRNAMQKSK